MQVAESPTRDKYPLSTKKIAKKTIAYSIIWVIILLFALIGLDIALSGKQLMILNLAIIAGIIFIVLITYLYELWYFKVYYYDLNNDFIVIRKGPITPHEITIPYERVQDVYVDQDILDRMFGIYDVHLSSATISSGMEAHIDGVAKEHADGLRDELLKTISERITRLRQAGDAPIQTQSQVQTQTQK